MPAGLDGNRADIARSLKRASLLDGNRADATVDDQAFLIYDRIISADEVFTGVYRSRAGAVAIIYGRRKQNRLPGRFQIIVRVAGQTLQTGAGRGHQINLVVTVPVRRKS